MVTASYPPFARQGQTIDVVSRGNVCVADVINDAVKRGGQPVYALAQGYNILVGGAGASAGGSSACRLTSLMAGASPMARLSNAYCRLSSGAGNTINLQLNDEALTMAQHHDAINRACGYGSATALSMRERYRCVRAQRQQPQVRFLATFKIWKST